jgi:hypothetical protein
MIGLLGFALAVLASPFKSKLQLQAENAVLRHQLIVLRRRLHGRVRLTNHDRWFFIQLYRWFLSILQVLTVIRPETLVRWHRAGFRCYWRWKSRRRGGRPRIEMELRALIRLMSTENQLCGAPRIHGGLLKLGFEIAQSSVATYMVKRRGPPSQRWRTLSCITTRQTLPPWTCSCSDDRFRPALCLRHRPARPQRPHLDQRHSKSHSRMGCTSNNGSIPWDETPHYLILMSARPGCIKAAIAVDLPHPILQDRDRARIRQAERTTSGRDPCRGIEGYG